MKRLLTMLTLMMLAWPGLLRAQEEPTRPYDRDPWLDGLTEQEERPRDLWYGTPGVRADNDLLRALLDLLRNPSHILDFKPRRGIPAPTDRESQELFHDPDGQQLRP